MIKITVKAKKQLYCPTCGKTMDSSKFYRSNRPENEGFFDSCKECTTLLIDNWDSNTFLPILERADVPYIPSEWFSLVARWCKDPTKVNNLTIIGKYLGKMRTNQWKNYRFSDSEILQKKMRTEEEELLRRMQVPQSEIDEILDSRDYTKESTIDKLKEETEPVVVAEVPVQPNFPPPKSAGELGLTTEDVDYLTLKWGSAYSPEEWVRLEQLWVEMNESYDINTAGERDSLKMICKTSLKAHQLIDAGDIDGYQKMTKVYELLMKQNKFTASQLKEEALTIDCLGKFVALCEQEGGQIPQFYAPEPRDRVDETLADTKRYLRTLVENESSLNTLIESAIVALKQENEGTENSAIEEIMNYDDSANESFSDDEIAAALEEWQAFEEDESAADLRYLEEEYGIS